MQPSGALRKMRADGIDPVHYSLRLGDEEVPLDDCLGEGLGFRFLGEIQCAACGRITPKSYGQGFCYPCFAGSAENSECIIRPELCRGHLGEGRDPEWERLHHVQEHVVYLAVTSGAKVGVTRATEVPTRWIDQGATAALILARTPYRQLAGRIEVMCKADVADRTNWRKMLKGDSASEVDLIAEKRRLSAMLDAELSTYVCEDDAILSIRFPVHRYPARVRSVSFDKQETIIGSLAGIKGQYLMFADDTVLNIRRHTGYLVEVLRD